MLKRSCPGAADAGPPLASGRLSRHGARPHSAHANPWFRQDTTAIGLASLTRSVLKMKRLIRPVRGFPRNTGLVNASATSRAARARREGLAFTALMDQV